MHPTSMPRVERRFTPTATGATRAGSARAAAAGNGKVRGHAAVYYKAGDPGTQYQLAPDILERLAPGCFDATLKVADVRCLWNHSQDAVLGRTASGTLRLRSDRTGLHYECDLPDTTTGRDLRVLLARGDVTGASFGFSVGREEWTREGTMHVRTIVSVATLYDVSPVAYPAYTAATSGTGAAPGTETHDDVLEAGRAATSGTVRDDDNAHVAAAKRRNQILEWMAWNPDEYDHA